MTSKAPRFPQLTLDQLDERQKPLGEQIVKVSSVGLGGPYNPMIRSPVLGQLLFDLFHYLRWQTSVPHKLNELAILIIARQWRSQIEWFAHAPIAAKAGLSADILAELKTGQRPSKMADDEALVYDFVTELTTTHKVSDDTWSRARKAFNDSRSSISPRSPATTSWWRCCWRWRSRACRRARSRRSRTVRNSRHSIRHYERSEAIRKRGVDCFVALRPAMAKTIEGAR